MSCLYVTTVDVQAKQVHEEEFAQWHYFCSNFYNERFIASPAATLNKSSLLKTISSENYAMQFILRLFSEFSEHHLWTYLVV